MTYLFCFERTVPGELLPHHPRVAWITPSCRTAPRLMLRRCPCSAAQPHAPHDSHQQHIGNTRPELHVKTRLPLPLTCLLPACLPNVAGIVDTQTVVQPRTAVLRFEKPPIVSSVLFFSPPTP